MFSPIRGITMTYFVGESSGLSTHTHTQCAYVYLKATEERADLVEIQISDLVQSNDENEHTPLS